eukprot:scaffold71_cov247-Pinguiococcus_pyrenoidosus.AAC.36
MRASSISAPRSICHSLKVALPNSARLGALFRVRARHEDSPAHCGGRRPSRASGSQLAARRRWVLPCSRSSAPLSPLRLCPRRAAETALSRRGWLQKAHRSARRSSWRLASSRGGVTEEGLRESEHLKLTKGASVAEPAVPEGQTWSVLTFTAPGGLPYGCAGREPDLDDFQAWLGHLGVAASSAEIHRCALGRHFYGIRRSLTRLWRRQRRGGRSGGAAEHVARHAASRAGSRPGESAAGQSVGLSRLSKEINFEVDALLEAFELEHSEFQEFQPTASLEEMRERLTRLLHLFREKLPYYHDRCLACGNTEDNKFLGVASYAIGDPVDAKAVRPMGRLELHQVRRAAEKSPSDRRGGIEAHPMTTEWRQCKACKTVSSFPRTNNVTQILRARRGRCGEYSVVMHEVLRYLGYTVRCVHETRQALKLFGEALIVDWADHQWVEVLLPGATSDEPQWVHCDPCEASLDEPLLYEGWGKNQTYILAYAPTYVKDVTSVYTTNITAATERREVGPGALPPPLPLLAAAANLIHFHV